MDRRCTSRRSLRAPVGGGAAAVAPGAPTISVAGGWIIGQALTIVAGTPGGSPLVTYVLYRDGVSAGAVVSGYTLAIADVGRVLTVRATNAVGTSLDSNAITYLPQTYASRALRVIDPRTAAVGAVSTIIDQKLGSFSYDQGTAANRPTKSATSLNGTAGITFDGVNDSLAGSTTIDLSGVGGKATLTFVCVDTATAVKVITQLIPSVNIIDAPGMQLATDVTGALIRAAAHGGGGSGAYGEATAPGSLAAPAIVSVGFDAAVVGGTGVSFVRVNGVALALTPTVTACAAGNFSAATIITLGAFLGGATFNWPGTLGWWVLSSDAQQDAQQETLEQFIAWQTGMAPL